MLLNLNELMSTNLKGFMYNEINKGYTGTGWGTIDHYYIVLEDDGEKCVVAELESRSQTRVLPKSVVARNIDKGSLCEWDSELKAYVNKTEKL